VPLLYSYPISLVSYSQSTSRRLTSRCVRTKSAKFLKISHNEFGINQFRKTYLLTIFGWIQYIVATFETPNHKKEVREEFKIKKGKLISTSSLQIKLQLYKSKPKGLHSRRKEI